jgi:hypothetical protein
LSGYPTMDQYNDTVQHPQTAFTDASLKSAKIATNGMGLPVALGGGAHSPIPLQLKAENLLFAASIRKQRA